MHRRIAPNKDNELGDTKVDWLGYLEIYDIEADKESKDELILIDGEGRILL